MTALNPAHRLSMQEVLAHPWLQGPRASAADIAAEFAKRKAMVDADAKLQRDEKRKERGARADARGPHRGSADATENAILLGEEEQKQWAELELEEFDAEAAKRTTFFSTAKPALVFADLKHLFDQSGVSAKVSGATWKLKCTIPASFAFAD